MATIIVAVAAAALFGAYVALVSSGQKTVSTLQLSTSNTSSTAATRSSNTSSTTRVTIVLPSGVGTDSALNFSPANITVVIGVNNTIVWVDRDSSGPHTVTALSVPSGAQIFDSGSSSPMTEGATFEVTLTVAGAYSYTCIFHPWMKGTIVVKQG